MSFVFGCARLLFDLAVTPCVLEALVLWLTRILFIWTLRIYDQNRFAVFSLRFDATCVGVRPGVEPTECFQVIQKWVMMFPVSVPITSLCVAMTKPDSFGDQQADFERERLPALRVTNTLARCLAPRWSWHHLNWVFPQIILFTERTVIEIGHGAKNRHLKYVGKRRLMIFAKLISDTCELYCVDIPWWKNRTQFISWKTDEPGWFL